MNGVQTVAALFEGIIKLIVTPTTFNLSIWFLAVIFAWSGISKLQQPVLTAMAIVDFGFGKRPHIVLGNLLATLEILIAVALATKTLLTLVLLFSLILLWFFVIIIERSLTRNKHFSCFCFGDSNAQLSKVTLIRTLLLALLSSSLFVTSLFTTNSAIWDDINLFLAVPAISILYIIIILSKTSRLLKWNRNTL